MEKKRKAIFILCGALAAGLVILVILALAAPKGEDFERKRSSVILEGNQQADQEGIYLWAEESGEPVLLAGDEAGVEWTFSVEESGAYYLNAGYMALEGNGQEIEVELLLDGGKLTDDDSSITLTRVWVDSGTFGHTAAGDEIRPSQSEASLWMDEPFRLAKKARIVLNLEKGEHSIRVQGEKQSALLQYLRLYREEPAPYAEYLAENAGQPAAEKDFFLQVEGEDTYMKSSSLLHDIYDRSSPFTLPYDPTCLRYNVIGGENWSDNGQWIEWQVQVPQDGFYQLGLRYQQNENKGQNSLRRLEIDGQVPFEEAGEISFAYHVNWQSGFLGEEGEPWLFYLTAGTHRLRLEVVLGELEGLLDEMYETLRDINSLYREIIMITGTDPDIYRDYKLETAIPDLSGRLSAILSALDAHIDYLETRYGENCYSARILIQMQTQMVSFQDKPYTIAKRLSVFKTNIEALAEWILEFGEQPLQIDYLYAAGRDADAPAADGSFFSKLGHEIRSFVGSFSHSYNEVASENAQGGDVTLQVWIGAGRDQANVMKRLIDEYFMPESHINVNISLVDGALVKATLAGQGPDVNVFTTRGEAMNLAFRGAVAALEGMEGFAGLEKEYADSAFVPYEYGGSVYGIPESQAFYVMFVRTDIFEELGIEIPDTWAELMALLPVLQSNSLSIGLPYTDGYASMNGGLGTINLFPTLLAQKNISVYQEGNDVITTSLAASEAYEAFQQWVNFYKQYDFDLYKDDFNRFRTGEMPIVISSYGLYNNLQEAAPEISGLWSMTMIPGTEEADGSINRATSASGSCSIVLEACESKSEAWEFVKWWNSAQVQAMYARDIEAELSTLGRYTPANLEAFRSSLWSEEEKALLLEQWELVVEVPEVPGGYYVSRNVDNAFRQVYYNGENSRDTFYYWMNSVNEELVRKQNQLKAREEKEK